MLDLCMNLSASFSTAVFLVILIQKLIKRCFGTFPTILQTPIFSYVEKQLTLDGSYFAIYN